MNLICYMLKKNCIYIYDADININILHCCDALARGR